MLQSRCISGPKSDFEFPRLLHATGVGKGDLVVSESRVLLLKWTYQMRMCMLVCLPVCEKKSREFVSSSEMMIGLT